jgi:hypothetical protein
MDELKNELRCVEEKWSVIEYMPLVMALCVTENEIGIGCDACTGEGLCCVLGICYVTSVRWMQIHSSKIITQLHAVLNLGR